MVKMKVIGMFFLSIILSIQLVSADFTIAVLPDTQGYSESNPEIFMSQTEWIRDNAEKENIVIVVHEGDIVNQQNNHTQWQNADKALSVLHDANLPYILSVGNHDMGSAEIEDANDRDTSTYNTYFPYTRFENKEWYGGHMGNDNDNYYVLFEADGMDFMIISLEFGPDGEILDWANNVVERHKDRRVIVVTHSYLNEDNNLMDWNYELNPHRYGIEKLGIEWYEIEGVKYEVGNDINQDYIKIINKMEKLRGEGQGRLRHNLKKIDDIPGKYIHEMWGTEDESDIIRYYVNRLGPFSGDEMWEEFIKKHENIFLVLSAHVLVDGNGRLTSEGDKGNKIHQVVSNYQFLPNGGDGWLKLYRFMPKDNQIIVNSFSPWLENDNLYEYARNSYKYFEVDVETGKPLKFFLEDEHDFELEYEMSEKSLSGITGSVVGVNESFEEKSLTWFWWILGIATVAVIFYFVKGKNE